MSDAPAASVNENGVPPFAQDTVEEAPGFKVMTPSYPILSFFISFVKGLRWKPRILYHG